MIMQIKKTYAEILVVCPFNKSLHISSYLSMNPRVVFPVFSRFDIPPHANIFTISSEQ